MRFPGRVAACALAVALSACAEPPRGSRAEGTSASPASATQSGPTVLDVSCDTDALTVMNDRVQAGGAGFHVRVENRSDDRVFFQFVHTGADAPWGGIDVAPGTTDLAIQLPPGPAAIRCSDGGDGITNETAIRVVDPDKVFVPYALMCDDKPLHLTPSAWSWSTRDSGLPDPIAWVRRQAVGIAPSDVVEIAGYPLAAQPVVRVVREGAVAAAFDLWPEGETWGAAYVSCEKSGVSLSA